MALWPFLVSVTDQLDFWRGVGRIVVDLVLVVAMFLVVRCLGTQLGSPSVVRARVGARERSRRRSVSHIQLVTV